MNPVNKVRSDPSSHQNQKLKFCLSNPNSNLTSSSPSSPFPFSNNKNLFPWSNIPHIILRRAPLTPNLPSQAGKKSAIRRLAESTSKHFKSCGLSMTKRSWRIHLRSLSWGVSLQRSRKSSSIRARARTFWICHSTWGTTRKPRRTRMRGRSVRFKSSTAGARSFRYGRITSKTIPMPCF